MATVFVTSNDDIQDCCNGTLIKHEDIFYVVTTAHGVINDLGALKGELKVLLNANSPNPESLQWFSYIHTARVRKEDGFGRRFDTCTLNRPYRVLLCEHIRTVTMYDV